MTTREKTTLKSQKASRHLTDAEKQVQPMPGEIDPNVKFQVMMVMQKAKNLLRRR